jgi:sulfur carrier protein
MITVSLNQESIQIEVNQFLIDLIKAKLNVADCFAVMVNKKFIPCTNYATTPLSDGDIIDIIVPMQGG